LSSSTSDGFRGGARFLTVGKMGMMVVNPQISPIGLDF
jgi:hypothetical protein